MGGLSSDLKERVTVPWIKSQKKQKKLSMLTAYDFPMATFLDQVGIDLLLVGDSVATVVYGHENTLSVTLETMLRHTEAVSRAVKRAFVVGDLPFMSYQVCSEEAVRNAGRFLKEAGASGVKLEGGLEMSSTVERITQAGIPVMGHIGLTPQSIHSIGKYRMHGKTDAERKYLLDSAKSLENAGAFAVVLECVKADLAKEITESLSIPTIGIGSSEDCDGQVLVTHDLLGMTIGKVPRFVDPVEDLKTRIEIAARQYQERVENRQTAPQTPGKKNRIIQSPLPSSLSSKSRRATWSQESSHASGR